MKKSLPLLLASIAISSYADNLNGLYVSGGWGVTSMTNSTLNNDFGQVGTSIQQTTTAQTANAKVGWVYADGLWSTELGYSYMWNGYGSDSNYSSSTNAQTIDLDQLLYARIRGTPFFGYIKAGVSYVWVNQTLTIQNSNYGGSPNNFTFNGGLGLGLGITENTQLRLDWTNYGWLMPIQTSAGNVNGSWTANTYTANIAVTF